MTIQANDAILVTGGSGVIGTALCAELADQGFANVHVITSRDADLRDKNAAETIVRRVKPALVYHLAARVSGIMGNMKNRAAAYYDNILINTHLIEACQENGVAKIVAMGTTAIYSDDVSLPMSEDDIWLGAPHHSERPYGHAKRAMLAQLEAYREQYGMDFAYAVSTNLYGENDRFDEQFGHVIPSLISKFHRAISAQEGVTVWGDGSPERDFLYSRDAARALIMIAEKASGPINMASGSTVAIRDAVETIRRVSGFEGEITWDASKPNGQQLRDYNIARLDGIGFRPAIALEEGLQRTWDWYSANAVSARR